MSTESIEEQLEYLGDKVADLISQVGELNREIRGLQSDLERRIGNVEDDVRRLENEVRR